MNNSVLLYLKRLFNKLLSVQEELTGGYPTFVEICPQ